VKVVDENIKTKDAYVTDAVDASPSVIAAG